MSKKFAVKPALLGLVCLLGAFLLAWFSPKEGVVGLLGMERGDWRMEGFKTKVRERGSEVRSVAEEYRMKAERGMTEDEVRWVVEDFLALGLDVDYPEDTTAEGYLALRKAREEWYLGALVSGLRLTKEQVMEARERMGVMREKDYAEFLEYLDGVKSFEHEGEEMKVFDGSKARELMDAGSWLEDEGYRPWALCEMAEGQLAVTNFHQKNNNEGKFVTFEDWLIEGDRMAEELPSEITNNIGDLYALDSFFWGHVVAFFPYSRVQLEKLFSQIEGSEKVTLLKYVMALQPVQLQVYLLFEPEAAESLLIASKGLEVPGE